MRSAVSLILAVYLSIEFLGFEGYSGVCRAAGKAEMIFWCS